MPEEYKVLKLNGKDAYIKTDSLSRLGKVNAVIFDCDGVLIDIRDSYNRAISKTVSYLLKALTGYAVPEQLISNEVIFMFRRSGGFNNDWDTVYGILMFILWGLPEKGRFELKRRTEKAGWRPDPFWRLSQLSKVAGKEFEANDLDEVFFKVLIDRLKEFTEFLDTSGVNSVDKKLMGLASASEGLDFYGLLKRFIYYPGEVGESIISTAFEEFFCGSKLFPETYDVETRFYKGVGTIENEQAIIRSETLDHLAIILGKANFGIASGRKLNLARYILGNLLERFDPNALVFLDYLEKAQYEYSIEGLRANLWKPNPFSLFKSAEALNPFDFALYVGDSMADAMTVTEARKTEQRFLFAGVYDYSNLEALLLSDFLKYGCDLILPSANELPFVLETIRRSMR